MAELVTIKATQQNGTETAYIGTIGNDGYVYFNDAMFYRFKPAGTWEENLYVLNRWRHSWMKCTMFTHLSATNLNSGGGSVAPGGEGIEGAVNWCINIANDDSHGYDQVYRDGGTDYDCSSFVGTGLRNSGFDVPFPSPATYTMIDALVPLGFVWHAGMGNDSSVLQRGDILLNIQDHVEFYIGGGQNVGAHINEFGGIVGGQPGDQTGNEISVTGYYAYPWDGVLRYGG